MATETSAKATLHQRAVPKSRTRFYFHLSLHHPGSGDPDEDGGATLRGCRIHPLGHRHNQSRRAGQIHLLGNAMKLGERTTTRPLIWPTLEKAFAFLVLLIILTTIEEAVVGLFHHQSIVASLGELFGPRLQETIAGFSSCCWCSFRIPPSWSSARCSAKAGCTDVFVEREPMKRRK